MSAMFYGGHGNPSGVLPNSAELDVVKRNGINQVLIPAYQQNQQGSIALYRAAGVQHFIIRACIGGKWDSAINFANVTLPILKQFAAALGGPNNMLIQLGNEPNLVDEGWTHAWQSGSDYAIWWLAVAAVYRANLPLCKLGFAPMSPGENIPGVRMDEEQFVPGCGAAIQSADFVVVHKYWSNSDASDLTIPLDMWRSQFGNKPLVIGETGPGGSALITAQAAEHAHAMYSAAGIPAMFYIMDSGNDARFNNAGWVQQKITLFNQPPLPTAPAPPIPPVVVGGYPLTTKDKIGIQIQECYADRLADGTLIADALLDMYTQAFVAGHRLWTRVDTDVDMANKMAKIANVIYRLVLGDHEIYQNYPFHDKAGAIAAANAMYDGVHKGYHDQVDPRCWLQFVNEAEYRPFDHEFNLQLARRAVADGRKLAMFGDATANRSREEWIARNPALDYCMASNGDAIVVVNGYGFMERLPDGTLRTTDHPVSTPADYLWFGNWMQDRYAVTSSQPYIVYAESQTSDAIYRGAPKLNADMKATWQLDMLYPWLLARLWYTGGRSWGHPEYEINEAIRPTAQMVMTL